MLYKSYQGRRFLWKIGCLTRILFTFFLLHSTIVPSQVLGTQSVTLAWDANEDSETTGYLVYSTDSTGNPIGRSDVGASTSATLSSLVEGTAYVFYVTAYDLTGRESEPSNKLTFQAPSQPPVVADKNLETYQNQAVPVVLSGSAAGRSLTYRIVSGPSYG